MKEPDKPDNAGRRCDRAVPSGLRLAGGSEIPAAPPALTHEEACLGDCDPLPPDRTQSILEATKQVAALLEAAGYPFALAGSVAAYAYGVPGSLRHDADFCILREDADTVAATLREARIHVRIPPEDWLLKARCRGEDIDLIFELADRPVTRDLLGRAQLLPVDSVRIPVLDATDLLGTKLAALSEQRCDFGAVLPIARTLREKVDWERLRREHGAAPMPAAFLYLLERLGVVQAQEAGS